MIPAEEQAGYKEAAPVITALEKFRLEHRHYPGALHELVPRYIRHVRQVAFWTPGYETNAFQYTPKGDRYSLNFSYLKGTTAEVRTYDSADKKWHTMIVDL
jgi:hypothetical protein